MTKMSVTELESEVQKSQKRIDKMRERISELEECDDDNENDDESNTISSNNEKPHEESDEEQKEDQKHSKYNTGRNKRADRKKVILPKRSVQTRKRRASDKDDASWTSNSNKKPRPSKKIVRMFYYDFTKLFVTKPN